MTLFKNKYRIESNRLKNWDYSSNAIYFLTICTCQRACVFGMIENGKMILNQNGVIVEEEILDSIKIRQDWIFHNWIVMPNHIHLLVEIKKHVIPQFSYSDKTIHSDDTDIELMNLYVSHVDMFDGNAETHCYASQQLETNSNSEIYDAKLETHNAETHSNASLHKTPDITKNLNLRTNDNHITTNKLSRRPRSISSFVGGIKGIVTLKINELNNQFEGSIWQSNYHDHIVRSYEEFKTIYYYIENNPKNWVEDTFNPINAKK
ncbi:transposase [Flavobacterium sp. ZB4R12]|uniref:transposase n=1 Tax=Flavobacterium sp. ZB4R12 TaxID=3398732 RepID=UPI003AAD2220